MIVVFGIDHQFFDDVIVGARIVLVLEHHPKVDVLEGRMVPIQVDGRLDGEEDVPDVFRRHGRRGILEGDVLERLEGIRDDLEADVFQSDGRGHDVVGRDGNLDAFALADDPCGKAQASDAGRTKADDGCHLPLLHASTSQWA